MKRIIIALLCAGLTLAFTACSSDGASQSSASSQSSNASPDEASKTSVTAQNDGNYDLSFTDRDSDTSYDESSCKIEFSDSTVKSDSNNGITIDGTGVTISKEGTYILSGKSSDASVMIAANDKAKIQLVLDGVELKSSKAPLVVKSADKVFITLAKDSENTLSDGSSYTLESDSSTVDAAIFSKADLTINGSGTLNVNGNYKHAVVSKDDLVITGGTLNIKSKNSGLDGKDCLKIKDADITVDAGSDSLRSTNTEETDKRGFIYIQSGSFKLTSNNDGIQAASLLRIDGGEFNISTGGGSSNGKVHNETMGRGMERFGSESDTVDTESAKALKAASDIKINGGSIKIDSSDDAVHSNGNITVSNGELTISTGDDGLHSDNTLTIDSGTIDITKSYEGIEGGEITVNGGNINLVSSDDGFNVAGGKDENARYDPFASDSSKKLTINGGYVLVDASGDGLDSNGSLAITGGMVLVSGPENSGNGALDYDSEGTITGGTLIALGSSGMAQSLTGNGQCTIMTDISSQSGNTSFALCDSSGSVIASFKPSKQYSNAVVSSPSIKTGETYKIVCGGTVSGADKNGFAESGSISSGTTVTEINLTEENYSSGGSMQGGMRGNPGGGMPGKPEGGMRGGEKNRMPGIM